MNRIGALALAFMMAVPSLGSAQSGMGHQHQQGQQQMMRQTQRIGQMMQQIATIHEQLRGLQDRMGPIEPMGQQIGGASHAMQHQQMRDMMGAVTEMAGQMHMALTSMVEMSGNPAMTADLHEDLQELGTHMQPITEGLAAGLEVMKRLHDRISGGQEGTR